MFYAAFMQRMHANKQNMPQNAKMSKRFLPQNVKMSGVKTFSAYNKFWDPNLSCFSAVALNLFNCTVPLTASCRAMSRWLPGNLVGQIKKPWDIMFFNLFFEMVLIWHGFCMSFFWPFCLWPFEIGIVWSQKNWRSKPRLGCPAQASAHPAPEQWQQPGEVVGMLVWVFSSVTAFGHNNAYF